MRYYYNDESNQVSGPVEEGFLYQACRTGSLSMGTMVVPEGGDAWMPLDEVLPYFFSYRGSVLGPLTLKQIQAFAAQAPDPVLVTEPGGSDWSPLPASVSTAPVPPPLPVGRSATPAAPPAVSQARHSKRAPAAIPGGVVAAGVIWTTYGGARLASTAVMLVHFFRLEPGFLVMGLVAALVPLLVALVFLNIGLKSVRGTVANLRTNGYASIGIAVVSSLLQYMMRTGSDDTITLLNIGLNFLLVLAGLMAISENDRYLAWKAAETGKAPTARRAR